MRAAPAATTRPPSARARVEAALTGLYPYGGVALTDWLSAWAAAGYGSGDVTVKEQGRSGTEGRPDPRHGEPWGCAAR